VDFLKILGIVGSPRLCGNTEILTKIALEEIKKNGIDTELIKLSDKNIAPCDACKACRITGECHIKDDFQNIYNKMVEAEGFILASPVWYGAATPQISNLISRCYVRGSKRPFENKVGGPIVIARRAGHNFTYAQLMFFYMISGMIVPGSTYWNVTFGQEKGDIIKDEEGIQIIKNFGTKISWLVKKLKK
jgi:multimeric flavodoxin WrbA